VCSNPDEDPKTRDSKPDPVTRGRPGSSCAFSGSFFGESSGDFRWDLIVIASGDFRKIQEDFPVEINGDFGRISKEILKVISCDLFELYWIFG
jgi:hypothetical protein